MRTSTCLLPKVFILSALVVALGSSLGVSSPAWGDAVVPASYQSGGFFNQSLGTALRFNYHTRGYGTQDDVFSLGAMKVVPLDGATVFFDGQGTLSDDFGGGFNLGVGYRQLTTTGMNFDPERILGLGFWTDGQSTASDNFFTQLGFSLESLGESFDLRLNGHFPLERTQTSDAVLTGTGSPFFLGNNIFGATERITIDTAHNVVDGEFAKRIMDLEAWGFIGGYQLGGGGVDATGYRVGVRGYAVPDLAVSLQVTDDDQYATNVMFGITWFIGRTHKGNAPCGNIMDRFREPVIRNDFIAMTNRQIEQASGNALTLQGTGDAVHVVHVDSNAAAGGDGTFENPFDTLTGAEGVQADDNIILVHAGSVLTDDIALATGVRMLGEGRDPNITVGDPVAVNHVVDTNEMGAINLPETSTDASIGATPIINAIAGADTFTMGDGSTVNNFVVNGGTRAVVASGIAAPTTGSMLSNLVLDGQTGDSVLLENVTGSLVVDNSVNISNAGGTAILVDGGDEGMDINANITANVAGSALTIQNRTGGTLNYGGLLTNTVSGTGINILNNADSTINLTNTSTDVTNPIDITTDAGSGIMISGNTGTTSVDFTGPVAVTATGASDGVVIANNEDTTTINFADLDATGENGNTVSVAGAGTMSFSSADDTRTIANTGTGNAFFNDGTVASAALTVNSNVENTGGSGFAVNVQNRAEAIDATFSGTVTGTGGGGVFAQNNSDGTLLFTDLVSTDSTGTNNGIELLNNTGATLSFSDLDLKTDDGDGFVATGGGDLLVTSTNGTNNIEVSGTGTGVDLQGMTIDAAGVTFDKVDVANGAGNGINLQNLDGTGLVTIGGGTSAGDGGLLTTTGTAINVSNADNVAMSNLTVSNSGAGAAGLNVTGQTAGSSAIFNGLEVNTSDDDAVTVAGNTDGTITLTSLTANAAGTGDAVVVNNNASATVSINGMDATATGSGNAFDATGTGNLTVTGTNTLNANTGQALNINGQTIVGSATFGEANVTNGTGSGVTLTSVDGGTVTVGSGTTAGDGGTMTTASTAIVVNDVQSAVVNAIQVNNTTAGGVSVINQQAGSTATLNSLELNTTSAIAASISGNTAGTIAVNNLDAETTTARAVNVQNNGSATVNLSSMTLQTTSGDGLFASGSGTLNVNGTNTIDTTTGVGINVDNASDASINNVTVTTTGSDAVSVIHTSSSTSDISFNNLTVAGAGNRGMDILANGSAEFDLAVTNSTIGSVGDEGLFLDTGASAGRVDFTLTGSTITTGDQHAVLATLDDSNTADVRMVIDDNTMSNASGTAGSDLATLDISVGSGLDASIRVGELYAGEDPPTGTIGDNNVFTNSSVDGDPVRISINDGGAGGTLNLDLRDNTAQSGSVQFSLTQTSGTFNLVDSVDTLDPNNANNVGDVIGAGTINTIAPPILAPTP